MNETEIKIESYIGIRGFSDRWNQPRFATTKKPRVKKVDCRVIYPGKPFEDCLETTFVTRAEYYLKREYYDLTISAICWASTPTTWIFSMDGVPQLKLSMHDCSYLYRALARFLREMRQARGLQAGGRAV